MKMAEITISQALGWLKTLKERHGELIGLRNQNSSRHERLFGEKETIKQEPVYDVKSLDRKVNVIAKEIRKLDTAIKSTNATQLVVGYNQDIDILDWEG
jgi:hypothetical protein